jgi:electron transfer flavoprotein alpha subunit
MATVREGVMKKEIYNENHKGEVRRLKAEDYINDSDFCIKIIERQIEAQKVNIKGAPIIVAGGYGMGSKENFALLHKLADLLGGEVGATRAAVDAGFTENERQIGQTGLTVRPKLYIACGISGAVQHRAGMDQSSMIISINTDPNAPINSIADYTIIGDAMDVLPKMIKSYKSNML